MPLAEPIVVLITCSTEEEAGRITRALVDEKLIACGNMISPVKSIFFWQGKTNDESEALIIAKSIKKKFPDIIERVKTLHSYSVPEIIALPVIAGSDEYLNWINETLSS
jgi:periplasmic divalent cation tolerance protein